MYRAMLGLLIGVILSAGSLQETTAKERGDLSEDQLEQVLGPAYVDIRTGFSVRPPFGSEIIGPGTATTRNSPESISALEEFSKWELLKFPESKPLVQFAQKENQQLLTVHQLVGKGKMEIDKMLEGREDYWKKYPNQAQVRQRRTDTINNRSVGQLTVSWSNEPKEPNQHIIREALIQQEKDRYFLLTLVSRGKGDTKAKSAENLMNMVVRNFECMDRQEQRQRWEQGRKRAELLLGSLDFHWLRELMVDEIWFRIMKDGKDVGYLQLRGQLGGDGYLIPVTQATPLTLEIYELEITVDIQSNVNNHADAVKLARMLDCGQGLTNGNGPGGEAAQKIDNTNLIRVNFNSTLLDSMKTEYFFFEYRGGDDNRYRESGEWNNGMLKAVRYDDPKNPGQSTVETLEVNSNLYLPGVTSHLLGLVLGPEVGLEYVFLRYSNRALRHYVVRVAGREQLEMEVAPVGEAGQRRVARRKISTWYVVGQAGAEGPIVETWLDQDGYTLRQRSEGLELLRSTKDNLKKLWPGQIRE